jgi:hypothetical protein
VKLNGKYGFIDKDGNEVINLIYEEASDFYNGYSLVKLNGEVFYINKSGKRVKKSLT